MSIFYLPLYPSLYFVLDVFSSSHNSVHSYPKQNEYTTVVRVEHVDERRNELYVCVRVDAFISPLVSCCRSSHT